MLPGMELMGCADLAVPAEVMRHVVRVESSFNPYAIGVVGGRLARQPRSLPEAVSTARMLEEKGYNFSLGLAQVNRYNLAPQGLATYERAFDSCKNLQAGSRILADCYRRSGSDWGKAFSCYYSGNFVTGFRHGYVQKVLAAWRGDAGGLPAAVGRLAVRGSIDAGASGGDPGSVVLRRISEAAGPTRDLAPVRQEDAHAAARLRTAAAAADRSTETGTPVDEGTSAAESPVVVQAMNPDWTRRKQGEPLPAISAQGVSPRRDDAFVF